jgi:glycerophosphoryl diester phosphodiesterase
MPSIIAHRGYSARYRENSPAAWRGAIEVRADYIEADVRITKDGRIVCSHDDDLKRLTGRENAVVSMTSQELAEIQEDGVQIAPPINALFDIVPVEQPILLDVKDESLPSLDILLAELRKEPARNMLLGLHSPASVRYVRENGWEGQILGLIQNIDEEAFFEAGGDILRIWEWDTTSGRIASHVERGRPVWICTGGGETGRRAGDYLGEEMIRMFKEGATGFAVNDPLSARNVLREVAGE